MSKIMLLFLILIITFFISCSVTHLYPGPKLESNEIAIIEDFPVGSLIDGNKVNGTVAVIPDKHDFFINSGIEFGGRITNPSSPIILDNLGRPITGGSRSFGCSFSFITKAGMRYRIEDNLSRSTNQITYEIFIIDVMTDNVVKSDRNVILREIQIRY